MCRYDQEHARQRGEQSGRSQRHPVVGCPVRKRRDVQRMARELQYNPGHPTLREQGGVMSQIRAGDRVTILVPNGSRRDEDGRTVPD